MFRHTQKTDRKRKNEDVQSTLRPQKLINTAQVPTHSPESATKPRERHQASTHPKQETTDERKKGGQTEGKTTRSKKKETLKPLGRQDSEH